VPVSLEPLSEALVAGALSRSRSLFADDVLAHASELHAAIDGARILVIGAVLDLRHDGPLLGAAGGRTRITRWHRRMDRGRSRPYANSFRGRSGGTPYEGHVRQPPQLFAEGLLREDIIRKPLDNGVRIRTAKQLLSHAPPVIMLQVSTPISFDHL
jgi:hypothetical protein